MHFPSIKILKTDQLSSHLGFGTFHAIFKCAHVPKICYIIIKWIFKSVLELLVDKVSNCIFIRAVLFIYIVFYLFSLVLFIDFVVYCFVEWICYMIKLIVDFLEIVSLSIILNITDRFSHVSFCCSLKHAKSIFRLLAFSADCRELCDCEVAERPAAASFSRQKPYAPKELVETGVSVSHSNVVLCSKFSPTHLLLASGCLGGHVSFYQPVLWFGFFVFGKM